MLLVVGNDELRRAAALSCCIPIPCRFHSLAGFWVASSRRSSMTFWRYPCPFSQPSLTLLLPPVPILPRRRSQLGDMIQGNPRLLQGIKDFYVEHRTRQARPADGSSCEPDADDGEGSKGTGDWISRKVGRSAVLRR